MREFLQVLIVEDDAGARSALSALLAAKGHSTSVVGSAEAAIDSLNAGCEPDFALVDLDLPGMNGAAFISHLRQSQPRVTPILISAAEKERVSRLLDPSIIHLRKPLNFEALLSLLNRVSSRAVRQSS